MISQSPAFSTNELPEGGGEVSVPKAFSHLRFFGSLRVDVLIHTFREPHWIRFIQIYLISKTSTDNQFPTVKFCHKMVPTSFQYRPLPPPPAKLIRLLSIHPSEDKTAPICLSFTNQPACIDIQDEAITPYEALSYVWGSEADPAPIAMITIDADGSTKHNTMLVTQNLATALRHLRLPSSPRTIWIDAICINQNDWTEKGHQVSFMGDVYEKAAHVVIWLGPEADDSNHALNILRDIGSQVTVDWNMQSMTPTPNARDPSLADIDTPFPDDGHYTPRDANAVEALLNRSWFERLWVLQEQALANNATFQAGHSTISRLDLRNAVYCTNVKNSEGSSPMAKLCRTDRAWLVVAMCRPRFPINLTEMRTYCEEMKCKDPRDRVYALLRLLSGFEREGGAAEVVRPDYTASVAEVYGDVVLKYIQATRKGDILAHAGVKDEEGGSKWWPSWTPDWSYEMERNMYGLPCSGGETFLAVVTDSSLEGTFLSMVGVQCAEITVTALPDDTTTPFATLASFRKLFRDVFAKVTAVQQPILLESMSRAVSAGRFRETFIPPENYYLPLSDVTDMLRKVLTTSEDFREENKEDPNLVLLGKHMTTWVQGRQYFMTSDGRFGLGPKATQPGDIVCLFLGTDTPLILRATEKNRHREFYQLVGDAFMHGIMAGEPFLGPLEIYQRQVYAFNESNRGSLSILNERTGEVVIKDPRIERLGLGLEAVDTFTSSGGELRYEISMQHLKEKGVAVQDFCLV